MTSMALVSRWPNRRRPRSNSVSGGRNVNRCAMAPNCVLQPGRHDQAARRAAAHVGAEKDAVRPVAQARRRGDGTRSLFDGKALAGQNRFTDEEVRRLEDDAVRRHQAAGREQHHVARHDLLRRHARSPARRAGREHASGRAPAAPLPPSPRGTRACIRYRRWPGRSTTTMIASTHSPVIADANAANTSTSSSGFRSWLSKHAASASGAGALRTSFGPYRRSRRAASACGQAVTARGELLQQGIGVGGPVLLVLEGRAGIAGRADRLPPPVHLTPTASAGCLVGGIAPGFPKSVATRMFCRAIMIEQLSLSGRGQSSPGRWKISHRSSLPGLSRSGVHAARLTSHFASHHAVHGLMLLHQCGDDLGNCVGLRFSPSVVHLLDEFLELRI